MKRLDIKQIFLLDGVGAVVSSVMLGVVLVEFEQFFGIPKSTLYFLAVLPLFFAMFDAYCYLNWSEHFQRPLRYIAFANLSYCALSLILAFYHQGFITIFGWIYILLEIIIIIILAFYELKIASSISLK